MKTPTTTKVNTEAKNNGDGELESGTLEIDLAFPCTDLGNAERLIHRYGPILRYCWQRNKWLVWNGKCWQFDDGEKVTFFAQATVRGIYLEAAGASDLKRREELARHAIQSENCRRIEGMINLARSSDPLTTIKIEELDQNPFLLNVRNGTIDLTTGELKPHDTRDMITIMIDVEYDPAAESETWNKFLNQIFDSKAELIEYLQRAMGYSITGSQEEIAFFFNHGTGFNGKTTFLGAIQDVLGPYATEIDPLAFMVDKHARTGPNEALASLYGKRLVCSTEVEDGQRLSPTLIKRMTGGEQIRCERKYEHGYNFKPTHKLWLSGNHEMTISDTTNSIWFRLKKVRYLNTISEEERITDFRHILSKEHSQAILAWLVKGSVKWRADGLCEPVEVKEAVAEYRERQDILHDYLVESCLVKPSETILVADLYKSYKPWCDENDAYCVGKNTFNTRMREKGFQQDRGTGNKLIWRGIRLLTEEEKVTLVTLVTRNPETSHTRARKGASRKSGNKSNLNNYPEKPCIQCGADEPVIDEKTGAYQCSKCQRFYPQPKEAAKC